MSSTARFLWILRTKFQILETVLVELQRQSPEALYKKAFLKMSQNSQESTTAESFLIKMYT